MTTGTGPTERDMPSAQRSLLILIILTATIAAGCGGGAATNRVTMVLFDVTATSYTAAIRNQYLGDFTKVLDT